MANTTKRAEKTMETTATTNKQDPQDTLAGWWIIYDVIYDMYTYIYICMYVFNAQYMSDMCKYIMSIYIYTYVDLY